jgi:hypothetical protein
MPRRPDLQRAYARCSWRGYSLRLWRGDLGRPLLRLAFGLVLICCAGSAIAASPTQATSSRAARDEAIRSVPLDKLSPDVKDKVAATLAGASIYRRLPIQVTDCDPDLYLFLVRHPEVVVNIWEVMQISNVALKRTGPETFRASDGAGTLCNVKVCYGDHETHVIYAEGSYEGPLFSRPVRAKCVLLLKSGYVQETNGRYFVTSRMDTFVQIEHAGVELLAKTLQLLVHRSADYNFVETAGFLGTISRTAEVNPNGMQRLAGKLANLEPEVRDRFIELSLEVGKRARQREAVQASAFAPLSKAAQHRALSER